MAGRPENLRNGYSLMRFLKDLPARSPEFEPILKAITKPSTWRDYAWHFNMTPVDTRRVIAVPGDFERQ